MGSIDSTTDNKLFVFLNPSAWIDPWDGLSCRIGVEQKISNKFSFTLEGGQYFYSQPTWSTKHDIKGFLIKPMLKYYLNKKGIANGNYVALEYMYKHQVFGYEDSISINQNPPFDKKYTIYRYVSCLNFKLGTVTSYKHSKFVYEYFWGFGLRYKSSTSNLSTEEENGRLEGEGHGDIIGSCQRSIGRFLSPNLCFGIKIGFRLR
jgi:hypothetical protein